MHFTVAIIKTKIYNFQGYDEKMAIFMPKANRWSAIRIIWIQMTAFVLTFFIKICTAYRFTFLCVAKLMHGCISSRVYSIVDWIYVKLTDDNYTGFEVIALLILSVAVSPWFQMISILESLIILNGSMYWKIWQHWYSLFSENFGRYACHWLALWW